MAPQDDTPTLPDVQQPQTAEELVDVAYTFYCDFYADPRSVSYFALGRVVDTQNVRVLDYVAEALDLGCRDSLEDHDKRTRDILTDEIGHPTDDQWDLVRGNDT